MQIQRLNHPLSERQCAVIHGMAQITLGHAWKPNFDDLFWVAKDGRAHVAFASMQACDQFAYLTMCGVLETHRGRGLQRRFIRTRVNKARQMGYERAVTYTAHDNLSSANNLIREGFRLYKPVSRYGLEGALYFEKFL